MIFRQWLCLLADSKEHKAIGSALSSDDSQKMPLWIRVFITAEFFHAFAAESTTAMAAKGFSQYCEENAICPICHCAMGIGMNYDLESAIETPCGHTFDKSCILRWLEQSSTCPLCRHVLVRERASHAIPMVPRNYTQRSARMTLIAYLEEIIFACFATVVIFSLVVILLQP